MKRLNAVLFFLLMASVASAQVLFKPWTNRKYVNSQTDTSSVMYLSSGQVALVLDANDSISVTVNIDYASGVGTHWETASFALASTTNTGLRWHRVLRTSYGGTGMDSTCVFGATQVRIRMVYGASGNGVTNDTLSVALVHE